MPSILSRKAAGTLLFAWFALVSGIAGADTQEQLDERALKLDQAIQALKKEVLDFNVEGQRAEDDILYPPYSRVSVYVAVRVPGLLLKQVTVSIDNAPAQTINYSDRDAKSLLSEQHMQRVLRANVGPGSHRIRFSYTGAMADAKADAPPIGDSYEAVFDKDSREAELELRIARPTRFSKAAVTMKQWRAKK